MAFLSTVNALLALSLLNPVSAANTPGPVHLPVSRNVENHNYKRMMQKRASGKYSSVDLTNLKSIYSINISIAGQETAVFIDTGSDELWVDPDCSTASRDNSTSSDSGDDGDSDIDTSSPAYCERIGRYDPSKSSTAKALNTGNVFVYADDTTIELNYYTDTIEIGGITITNQQFGVANQTNATSQGIMGIGPNPNDGYNSSLPYSLILETMVTQGQIASRAFSLDLRDYDNSTGSIILGGLDKKKFSGSLTTLPIEDVEMTSPSYNDGKTSFTDYGYYVSIQSLGITKPNTTSSSKYSQDSFYAVLDSGTTDILTPEGLTSQICSDIGGSENTSGDSSYCLVDCAVRDQPGGLDVNFKGTTIQVTYENLVTELLENGVSYCFLAVSDSTVATTPPTYILGDPFLRAAYAVFDWDNKQVHLAQADDCGSDIVAIGKGTNAVPSGGGCKTSSGAISAEWSMGMMVAIISTSMMALV